MKTTVPLVWLPGENPRDLTRPFPAEGDAEGDRSKFSLSAARAHTNSAGACWRRLRAVFQRMKSSTLVPVSRFSPSCVARVAFV
jgi:hypothetical protein